MVAYAQSNVAPEQRHTARKPCEICGGYDLMPHGQGVRCAGYRVGDAVYCQRPQYAGPGTPYAPRGDVYRHWLKGTCACGTMHRDPTGGYGASTYRPSGTRTIPLPPAAPKPAQPRGQLTDTYNYQRADGTLAFQVLRYRLPDGGKTFRQRRPDGAGGWLWSTAGIELVPYRLPELLAAPADQPVFIVEGEKDVERLRELGITATCNPMGAGKWTHPGYSEALRGRSCVVLADNDTAGRSHGDDVGSALHGVATSVKVMALPGLPERGDVSDWLDMGGTADQLLAWAGVWPLWQTPEMVHVPSSSAFSPSSEVAKPEVSPDARCKRACSCCTWKRAVVTAAKNRGSRDLLATYIGMDDHFRRRAVMGMAVDVAFRVSTAHKAKESGCSSGTYLSAAKELSAKGVLAYSQRHARAGDKRPDGSKYDRPETHSFLAVPGGPDAALARFAVLPPEPERRGGKRTPTELPACGSCGSPHVSAICEDCGEFQELTCKVRPVDPVDDNEFSGGDHCPAIPGAEMVHVPSAVSENQSLLPIYGGGSSICGAPKTDGQHGDCVGCDWGETETDGQHGTCTISAAADVCPWCEGDEPDQCACGHMDDPVPPNADQWEDDPS